MAISCRLLIDLPASGAWNMAVDEWLLAWTGKANQPVLRLYQWSEPTLSLGYFQAWRTRQTHTASLPCPMVRRLSGGGAIVHDRELTYSLALPAHLVPNHQPSALYGLVHESLVALFGQWGLKTHLWECPCLAIEAVRDAHPTGQADSGQEDVSAAVQADPDQEPFLCFQRRARWDVVADPPGKPNVNHQIKLVGSAQRRTRLAVLQHGSILLGRSSAAPELPGLNELLSRPIRPEEIVPHWLRILAERLSWTWQPSTLTAQEQAEAEELVRCKYGSPSWNLRR